MTYDSATNTATFGFAAWPNGTYSAELVAAGISDGTSNLDGNGDGTAGDDYTTTFGILAGDANHDGTVGFDDLLTLSQNYGSSGKTFSQGNFDYDPLGKVDFSDLLILAQNYAPNVAPVTPVNQSPAAGAANVPTTVTLTASAFSDPDAGDTHAASEWIVMRAADSVTVFDSGEDTVNKLSDQVSGLANSTEYKFKVRYKDSRGTWSAYSSATNFTTQAVLPSQVAVGLTSPAKLFVLNGDIWFIDNTSTNGIIKRVSVGGGSVSTIVTQTNTSQGGQVHSVKEFAIEGSLICVNFGDDGSSYLGSAPIAGGIANPYTYRVNGGRMLGVCGGYIYFLDGSSIRKMPAGDGSDTPVAPAVAVDVGASVVSGQTIYFVDNTTREVRRLDTAGSTISAVTSPLAAVGTAIAVDASNLFVTVSGSVQKVSRSGGTPTTLVNSGTAKGWASDGQYLYYTDGTALKAIPTAGGTSVTLATIVANSVTSVVFDASNVYWSDASGGTGNGKIWRVAKPIVSGSLRTATDLEPLAASPSGKKKPLVQLELLS